MIGAYEIVKWLHIVSSTILFGLGLGTAYYMLQSWRSGNAHLASEIGRMVVKADWIFTTTSGVVQPLSGMALVIMGGWSPWEGWLLVSYALYALAFCCWVPVVVLQIRATRLARAAALSGAELPDSYHAAMRVWYRLGWPAFLALLTIFLLMIAKPDLGSL
ncbi:DUF2269 family protein [Dongia sp.]|uniref:DUF2269 family protein n=1 Tax=Dongia sp. TaxID=1977262 RepID=UPI0035AF728F